MSKKRFTYIGLDKAFCKELEELCEKYVIGDYAYSSLRPKNQNLAEHCFKTRQNIIFIDLSLLKSDEILSIVEQVSFIKQQPALRGTLFALIFENTKSFQEHEWLISKGFQITFTLGQDLVNFFMDCYRIAIGDDYALPQFAKATNMETKLEMFYGASLLALSKKYALIETDLNLSGDPTLKAEFPCFPDLSAVEIKIKQHFEYGLSGLGLDTYLLEMPIPDPWEEITEDTLAEETIETWLENHKEDSIERAPFIYLFNLADPENIKKAYYAGLETQLNFVFESDSFCLEELQQAIALRRPSLIFLELLEKELPPRQDDLEQENLFETDFSPLEQMISAIAAQEDDYRPIVVLGSCPSSSEAIRKSFRYEAILANCGPLRWEQIEQLSVKFQEKKPDKFNMHDLSFLNLTRKISDFRTCINTTVTSLSEHEITFFAPEGLPMYGVLKTLLPVKAYITIIPPVIDLAQKEGLQHYMGILHGVDEAQLNKLRQAVNRLIHRPLDEFKVDSFLLTETKDQQFLPEAHFEPQGPNLDHSKHGKKHDKIEDTFVRNNSYKRTKL